MNKKRGGIRPFRILSVCLGVIALMMISRFPQQQVALAAHAYYDAQSENNRLTTELAEINTSDFIERTARRDHGYCWYGEIIYEVANLDEIKAAQEFAVYGQE